IKRIGRNRFVRNVLYAIGNSGNVELIDSAKKLQLDLDPVVKDAADWAIAKLKGSTNG
ncbi:epoxyqueuosine reductase, partial [Amylibacter sp.]|nr:epoxyqueuosine reductase [Amylibacter sp.]